MNTSSQPADAPSPFTHEHSTEEKRFALLIRNIAEIVALIDAQGTVRFVSSQVEKLLNWKVTEVTGRNIFEFIHSDDVARAALEYQQTITLEGEHVPSVSRFQHRNGEWIPLEVIANNQLRNLEINAVIFTARDLRYRNDVKAEIERANQDVELRVEERTIELARANASLRLEVQSRLLAEKRLQDNVSLLNATLESTADGVIVIANDGSVTRFNHKFLAMWGFDQLPAIATDNELLASAAAQVKDPDQFVAAVRQLYSKPESISFDVLYLKDGRIFERYSQPQMINSVIVGRVWSFRDVTKTRRLENELHQAKKLEAIGRLAGGIAHDFNNLLMVISGYVSQLCAYDTLAPEHRAICDQIRSATDRAATITKQLLALGRRQQTTKRIIDLNAVVAGMEFTLHRLLPKAIRIEILLYGSALPIYADASQIEMIIMNLAINARDAMPSGGTFSIRTSKRSPVVDTNSVESHPASYAIIELRDTGEGISEDVLAHIFEPFFTTKEVGKGTGLGLSTVYGIVEGSRGQIKVDSEPGRGTTFCVLFPINDEECGTDTAQKRDAPPKRGSETILLAEDEADIRTMTRIYLEGLGYRVLEASDGAQAVRVSKEYRGDVQLLLTDVQMPGMRGDLMAEEISKARPKIKVLYATGYAENVQDNGQRSVIYKPFEFPELGRKVRELLDAS